MRILVAFDKFKGSLTAPQACDIARVELERLGHEVTTAPLTDGGDGFAHLLTEAATGTHILANVRGPLDAPTEAHFGIVKAASIPEAARSIGQLPDEGTIALVDIASSSGIVLITPEQRDPWRTTTRGLGELIASAMGHQPAAILIGLGGSATSDLALGAMTALGLRCRLDDGTVVSHAPPHLWHRIVGFEGKLPAELPLIRLACDVTNPLLGPRGAVSVFAPQKGLRYVDAARLEDQTARMARLLAEHFGKAHTLLDEEGAGAAGGAGFGLRVALGAQLVPGFNLVAQWLQIPHYLNDVDLLITGEGRFDCSSLDGKGPGRLLQMAAERGIPAHVFAGSIGENLPGDVQTHAIAPASQSEAEAMCAAAENLRQSITTVIAGLAR